MTRKKIEDNISKGVYKLDYELFTGTYWAENVIVDASKDETWNRNAVEEHNEEVRALNTIFEENLLDKSNLFRRDIINALYDETILFLVNNKRNEEAISNVLIEIFDNVFNNMISPESYIRRAQIYYGASNDISGYFKEFYESYVFEVDRCIKYVVLALKT